MGRSGGSSSGGGGHSSGGHSSGGFGGGHSSGGFSGGGRSSGGGFSRGSMGGSPWNSTPHGHRPPPPPRPMYWGHRYYGGPYYGPRPVYTRTSIWSVVIVIIIFFMIFLLPTINEFMPTSSVKVPKNKTERTALSGVVSKTDWYKDDIGWVSSKNTLITGLEDFYKKTGVQPYVLFVPYVSELWNGNDINAVKADEYLEKVYAEKFNDEAHFIFAYFQCRNDSKSEMDGAFRYLSGYSADTIMDNEAINILWGYFEKNYYNTSLSLETMISKTFSETAKSIMSKPTNGWDFVIILVVAIIVIIVIYFIYKTIKANNQRAKEKEEYTEKILEKPLETFGTDTSELEKKYEDK